MKKKKKEQSEWENEPVETKKSKAGAHVDECGKEEGGGLDFGKESINKFKLSVS